MNKYKTIGIIGGQGPTSTADFYIRIIKYFQINLGTRHVGDFPQIIIYSVPTPDLVEKIEDEEKIFTLISEAIIKLEKDGSDFIVIACNSLQYLNKKFQELIKIPLIGIAPIIADYCKTKKFKSVGILSTSTTLKKKVYDRYFQEQNIKLITPNKYDQNFIEETILNEYSGKITLKDTEKLKIISQELIDRGAEAVLLACTELPLILHQINVDFPLIDGNEIYAIKTAQLSSNS